MTHRVYNFNPGPGTLPLSVLEEIQAELLDYQGTGISVMEMSHRSAEYAAIHAQAQQGIAELLGLDDDFKVLFLQGGASTQFFMLPMNFISQGAKADYIDTGRWSSNAIKEAQRWGDVHIAYSAKRDGHYRHVPQPEALALRQGIRYLHFTSNNTVAGTQYHSFPEAPQGAFLACDMSSDFMWRPFDSSRFGFIYAGAQKNLGPAGVTVVLIRKSLLSLCNEALPTMLRYGVQVERDSLFNTGPVFGIYVVSKVVQWIQKQGGLKAMENHHRAMAEKLYKTIDAYGDFYLAPVQKDSRSYMNVVWRLPKPEWEAKFLKGAQERGMIGLKGHRSVGGIRASLYNAMTMDGVDHLVQWMHDFIKMV